MSLPRILAVLALLAASPAEVDENSPRDGGEIIFTENEVDRSAAAAKWTKAAVGDSVNTAARLEGLNKMLGTSILVTRAVLDRCDGVERYLSRRMGSFVLKGKTLGIEVFEILGRRDDPAGVVRERSADYLRLYQEGLVAFQSGDLWRAADCFGRSLKLHDRLEGLPRTFRAGGERWRWIRSDDQMSS